MAGGFLGDRNGGRQAGDLVDVRLFELAHELAGVRGEGGDIAALALGVEGIEGHRRLARAGDAGKADELVFGEFEMDVLEVVDAGAADDDVVGFHELPGAGGKCSVNFFLTEWRSLFFREINSFRDSRVATLIDNLAGVAKLFNLVYCGQGARSEEELADILTLPGGAFILRGVGEWTENSVKLSFE